LATGALWRAGPDIHVEHHHCSKRATALATAPHPVAVPYSVRVVAHLARQTLLVNLPATGCSKRFAVRAARAAILLIVAVGVR